MTAERFTISGDRSISDHRKKRLYDLSDFDGIISVTECLNEQEDTIHQLSLRINEVSTKYRFLKEFSEDTNPNDAVKHVLHELMMNTKELRR